MNEMHLKYYFYENNPVQKDEYPKLVLVFFYGDVNIADVCFEFNKEPMLPSDDARSSCAVHAQLSFRAEGTPLKNAVQAINIALQTVDCSSHSSIVNEYVERGIPDGYSNGYLVVDPLLYAGQ